jgi:hypothetical protein
MGGGYDQSMPSPFPGMDPYLEHPALWPDVHDSVLAALRDTLAPLVAPPAPTWAVDCHGRRRVPNLTHPDGPVTKVKPTA